MVRWNLGAWLGQVHKPLRIIDTGGPCNHLAFSPDGRSFATGYVPHDRANATPIDLWDTASGRKLSSLPGAFAPFAFRPDGKVLVAHRGQWRRMVAVDLATGRVLWTTADLPGEPGRAIHFSPDGSTLLADRDYGSSRDTWVNSTGRRHRPAARRADARPGMDGCCSRRQNGRHRPSREWRGVHRCATSCPRAGGRHPGEPAGKHPSDLRLQPRWEVTVRVTLRSRRQWLQEHRLRTDLGPGHRKTDQSAHGRGSTRATFTHPRAIVFCHETDSKRSVRDADTGSERGSRVPAGGVIASHPDGRTMLNGTSDDTRPVVAGVGGCGAGCRRRNRQEGNADRERSQPPMAWVQCFPVRLLRADGQIAVSLADGAGGQEVIRLSDPATGRPFGRPAPHYPGWIVRAVAFSPDGRCFATGSNPDDSLRRRGATLGREHGPVAAPADAAHQLGRGTGIPARRQGRWPRAITTDSSGSGIPPPARKSAGRFLKERSS